MNQHLQAALSTRTAIDRVVEYFSPGRGLRRLNARVLLAAATGQGGYTGGRRDRRGTRNWRPYEASADADILPDLPSLRARARDLARNTPIATGAIATAVTNVVGDGLQLQAAIDHEALGLSEEQADAWERQAEREWSLFCSTADFTRVQVFDELQSLIFRASLESGDVFVVRRFRRDAGDVYGTKVQVLEADRVSNPSRAQDTDRIVAGVEVDTDGMPAAYHVSDRHPGGPRATAMKWQRVAARTAEGKQVVLHLYDRLRPEQTRGVPYLAPVIEHLKQLGDYSDAEVTAAVVSAMYTVFVKSDASQQTTAIAGERPRGAGLDVNELQLGNGAILGLNPQESVEIANPARPNANFDPFVQAFLRQVGVALELPFELLIKHFTASYSASRAALEMAWQFFRRRRTWLARGLCEVVYAWCIEEAVALGRLDAPGFFDDPAVRQAYLWAEWRGPRRVSINPKQEAEADAIDLGMGVTTREQICIERTGGEFEDKHRQLAKEETMRREDGLGAPPPGQENSAADEDDVAGDDGDDETQPARRRA
ncbi:MAG: phage portal protein [Phycisphaeraceae bacterium]